MIRIITFLGLYWGLPVRERAVYIYIYTNTYTHIHLSAHMVISYTLLSNYCRKQSAQQCHPEDPVLRIPYKRRAAARLPLEKRMHVHNTDSGFSPKALKKTSVYVGRYITIHP